MNILAINSDDYPICPVCGEECDTIVLNENRNVIGCENCLTIRDAWFWKEEQLEEI